jgi:transposase, IS5 family
MRTKITIQPCFPLVFDGLPKEVADFQERYNAIDRLLDENPAVLSAAHADLCRIGSDSGRKSTFSSEQFLRMIIVMTCEGLCLRDTIVRVADSAFLRNFTRINSGEMMNFTALQSALKVLRPVTWQKINIILFNHARIEELISGERLRVDSTVCESNIHYPTDASLLWDCYRTAARLMRQCIAASPNLDMGNRFRTKRVKRLYTFVSTQGGRKKSTRAVRCRMNALIKSVDWICAVTRRFLDNATHAGAQTAEAVVIAQQMEQTLPLMRQVVSCARRVYNGETVPASQRIFSIFEPHTELLKRGKARKPVEFGHMVTIAQTAQKFISFYNIEEVSRHDIKLGDEALEDHKKKFGCYPDEFTADKNYYGGPEHLAKWEKKIPAYAVGKKGRRNEEETKREHSALFRLLQKFRAGCEGSISVLKRVFGLVRCRFRGFKSFTASIGRIVFCHNLVIVSRLC